MTAYLATPFFVFLVVSVISYLVQEHRTSIRKNWPTIPRALALNKTYMAILTNATLILALFFAMSACNSQRSDDTYSGADTADVNSQVETATDSSTAIDIEVDATKPERSLVVRDSIKRIDSVKRIISRNVERKIERSAIQQQVAQHLKNPPRKLYYDLLTKENRQGDTIRFRVILWDNVNKPVVAPKDYMIRVEVTGLKSRFHYKDSVIIKQGAKSAIVTLVPSQPGVFRIVCSNTEMIAAEWIINVRPSGVQTGSINVSRSEIFQLTSFQPQPSERAMVYIYTQTEKFVQADGKDAAEIFLQLEDVYDKITPGEQVSLILHASNGNLSAQTIRLTENEIVPVKLVCDDVGVVTLKVRTSHPRVNIDNNGEQLIYFWAPIDHFELSSSSPINLFSEAEVSIKLKKSDSTIIETDRDLRALLEIADGFGQLRPDTIVIRQGSTFGKVKLLPSAAGTITVKAWLPDMALQTAEVSVEWPVLLIFLTLAGGLSGGLISYMTGAKKKKVTPIVAGFFTGFCLYWMVVFFEIVSLAKGVILNPLTAIFFSLLGGWLGVEVFRLIAKKFGFTI